MRTATGVVAGVSVELARAGEDLFAWLDRVHGGFDATKYRQVLGAANPFKEGDARQASGRGRPGLARERPSSAVEHHHRFLAVTPDFRRRGRGVCGRPRGRRRASRASSAGRWASWCGSCSDESEEAIKAVMPGLTSDVIACAVKLMANDDLIAVGAEGVQPAARVEHRRARLHGRADPAELTDRRARGHRHAGVRRLVVRRRRRRARHQSRVERRGPRRCHRAGAARRAGGVRPRARDAALRARAHRRAGGSRGAVPRLHGAVVSKPRRRRGRQRGVRHRRRADGRLCRDAQRAVRDVLRNRDRAPTPPTATARASTW